MHATVGGRCRWGFVRTIHRRDPDYPERLEHLTCLKGGPPDEITLSAPLVQGVPVVAIVGTRAPCREADAFARALAASVVGAGGIVASGAAFGIDTAAHEGALDAGGRTWAIAPSGSDFDVPDGSASLYARIRTKEGSAIVWPFARHVRGRSEPYFTRNGVLAALADALVVVQAGFKSGARNASAKARKLGRPVWTIVPAPWERETAGSDGPAPDFAGCIEELRLGARLLTGTAELLASVGLNRHDPENVPSTPSPRRPLDATEVRVMKALSSAPRHPDEVALRLGLPAHTVATALLTLALEDVVVEGPGGFFRRVAGI